MVVDMVRDAWWYWGTSGKEGAEFRVLGGSQVSSRVSCAFASWKAHNACHNLVWNVGSTCVLLPPCNQYPLCLHICSQLAGTEDISASCSWFLAKLSQTSVVLFSIHCLV